MQATEKGQTVFEAALTSMVDQASGHPHPSTASQAGHEPWGVGTARSAYALLSWVLWGRLPSGLTRAVCWWGSGLSLPPVPTLGVPLPLPSASPFEGEPALLGRDRALLGKPCWAVCRCIPLMWLLGSFQVFSFPSLFKRPVSFRCEQFSPDWESGMGALLFPPCTEPFPDL